MNLQSPPKLLTIAGSDSGGGAGIQADLKTFAAHRCFGMSVITALTAQNTVTVSDVFDVPPTMVRAQLRAVVDDIGCDAAKIGMLSRPETITSVAEFLSETPLPNLVLDPVMVSKSGHRLLSAEALSTLKTRLLPKAALITPNLPEVGELLGYLPRTAEEMVRAAHHLGDLTPAAVLIKGGHLESGAIVDVLWDGSEIHRFDSSRLPAVHTHGTGCTLSAAIACQLALGWPLPQAVANAREYLRAAMQHAYPVGCGIGPVNHLWEFGDPKVAPQPVF